MKENKEVADFYDKFWADLDQKNLSGINSRHRYILRNLKKAGLKRNSRVLEIGCGLGMLTGFIASAIPAGMIRGVDISPESIEYAKNKYASRKNISFEVNDMTSFDSKEVFDFVVFPDVLEHIPIEAHFNIFKTIRQLIHDESIVLVNIPNPPALEYLHIHQPEALQIIDQPLHTDQLLKAIYASGFRLDQLTTYSIFYKQADYQSMLLKPALPFTKMENKDKISVLRRSILLRIENFLS